MRSRAFLLPALLLLLAGPPSLAAGRWFPLGPFGGSIDALTVDPMNPRVLYTVLGTEGIFKSTDGGATWVNIRPGYSIGAVAVDPARPATLYVTDSGVRKSNDGGRHWTVLGLPATGQASSVAVDPVRSSRVYAGTGDQGVLYSLDGGASWNPARAPLPATAGDVWQVIASRPSGRVFALTEGGLFRSADGGLSWFPAEGLPSGPPGALAVDAAHPWSVYLSLQADGIPLLFHSSDGGASWTPAAGRPAETGVIRSLAVAAGVVWAGTEPGGLFRSADRGAHWTAVGPSPLGSVTAVFVSPTSPATLYLGTMAEGVDLGGVFASVDGGVSWTRRNQGLTGQWVSDLETVPAIPGWLWATLPHRGLYQSTDEGRTWNLASVPEVDGTALASSPADPLLLYLASLSPQRLWRTLDGGLSWTQIPEGHPLPGIDLRNPLRLWAWRNDGLVMSRNGGRTWTRVLLPLQDYVCRIHLAFAPSSADILYLSGSLNVTQPTCRYQKPFFLRSTDGGVSWTAAGTPGGPSAGPLAVDPADPRLVYAGSQGDFRTRGSGVSRSTDGGATWTPASEAMSRSGVSALVAPRPGVAWSAAGDYTQLRIFRSGDGGATWQDFRKNLRADVIYGLAADPVTRRIYAATSSGVWALEDDEQ